MNESERPSVEGLMQRIHYTIQQGDGAWRLSEPRLRAYAERLCAVSAQPVASNKATDEQVTEWAARYDLGGNLSEWRCMFEDAQTLIPAANAGEKP